jgi:peroxiredoxin
MAALPDFSLPDLDGCTWRRADLLGRPAVLFCFSTW